MGGDGSPHSPGLSDTLEAQIASLDKEEQDIQQKLSAYRRQDSDDEAPGEKRKAKTQSSSEPPKKRLVSTITSAPAPPFRTMRASLPLHSSNNAGNTDTNSTAVMNEDGDESRPRARPVGRTDAATRGRNQRLLGVVLGTLQQAKRDRDKEINDQNATTFKQRQLTKKVEERDEEERAVLEQRHKALVEERKRKKLELLLERRRKEKEAHEKRLRQEKERELARLRSLWNNQQTKLSNFLITTTNPPIAYLPAKHNTQTKELLQQRKMTLESRLHKPPPSEEDTKDTVDNHSDSDNTDGSNKATRKIDRGEHNQTIRVKITNNKKDSSNNDDNDDHDDDNDNNNDDTNKRDHDETEDNDDHNKKRGSSDDDNSDNDTSKSRRNNHQQDSMNTNE